MNSNGEDNLPTVELFVKASSVVPGNSGEDPISQKWFMAFYVLVENKYINLRVTPVDIKNVAATPEYDKLNLSKQLPVALVVDGKDPITGDDLSGTVADADDSIEILMNRFKCPGLELGASAFKVTEMMFRNFNIFLQTDNSSKLINDLGKLNKFLEDRDTSYLQGDSLSYVDCVVMPKLQHIRVACKELKNFDIPSEFAYLWKYFSSMYATSAFNYSCPADRDIIIHYLGKLNMSPVARQKRLTQEKHLLRDENKTNTVPTGFDVVEVNEGDVELETDMPVKSGVPSHAQLSDTE